MRTQLNRVKIPNVVLIGATGSGKSTVASQLAQLLGFGVIDIDNTVEKRAERKISEIFKNDGQEGFRNYEAQVIDEISDILNHVIVPGAGALEREENVTKLRKLGPLVWLATPTIEIVNRLVMKPDELRVRPLLANAVDIEDKDERAKFLCKIIDENMHDRQTLYSQAELTLGSCHATSEINATLIKSMLLKYGSPQPEPDRL
jgi:shikimate kinase